MNFGDYAVYQALCASRAEFDMQNGSFVDLPKVAT